MTPSDADILRAAYRCIFPSHTALYDYSSMLDPNKRGWAQVVILALKLQRAGLSGEELCKMATNAEAEYRAYLSHHAHTTSLASAAEYHSGKKSRRKSSSGLSPAERAENTRRLMEALRASIAQ